MAVTPSYSYPTAGTPGQVILVGDSNNDSMLPVNSGNPLPASAGGNVPAGTTDSGNPVKIGSVANSATPTAVTAGQRVNAWYNLNGAAVVASASVSTVAGADGSTVLSSLIGPTGAFAFLATQGFNYNGTNMVATRGDAGGGTVVQSCLQSARISYNSGASGICTNTTTAVTMFAAAGASVRNYLKTLVINTDAMGAAGVIAIRDGAGGTIIWSAKVATTGWLTPQTITFDPPIRSTANTLLEIVTLTASVTGSLYVTAQGFTAA